MSEETDQPEVDTTDIEPQETEAIEESAPQVEDGNQGEGLETEHPAAEETASEQGSLETDSTQPEKEVAPVRDFEKEIATWEDRYKHLQGDYTQKAQTLKAYKEIGDDPHKIQEDLRQWNDYQSRVTLKPHHPSSPQHSEFQKAYKSSMEAQKALQIMQQGAAWSSLSPEEQQSEVNRTLSEYGVTDDGRQLLNGWASDLAQETEQFQVMGPTAFFQEQLDRMLPDIMEKATSQVFSVMDAQRKVDSFMETNKDLVNTEAFTQAYRETNNADAAAQIAKLQLENQQLREGRVQVAEQNAGNKAREQASEAPADGSPRPVRTEKKKTDLADLQGKSNEEFLDALFVKP